MPRKAFVHDILVAEADPPPGIRQIQQFDGECVSFHYHYTTGHTNCEVELRLLPLDVDAYPGGNEFLLFTDDQSIDPTILQSLQVLQIAVTGMTVHSALQEIAAGLHQSLTEVDGQYSGRKSVASCEIPATPAERIPTPHEQNDDFDVDDLDFDVVDDDFGFDDLVTDHAPIRKTSVTRPLTKAIPARLKRDLYAAKQAGFKVGTYGDPVDGGMVSISIRTVKLGISEEAMRAWNVVKSKYLVLLICFSKEYKDITYMQNEKTLDGKVQMRVGLCDNYKPRLEHAYQAFDPGTVNDAVEPSNDATTGAALTGKLEALFIGGSIHNLLRDRFPRIVDFRRQGLSWLGAEELYHDVQSMALANLAQDLTRYHDLDDSEQGQALPPIVQADALDNAAWDKASLPLVAMQFVLRHIVRCTEFCSICHRRVDDEFEALRPYVCSNPLCLYQYLALGFGPSVEWEIIWQPNVVDLLINLCFWHAASPVPTDLPINIGLKVPLLPLHISQSPWASSAPPPRNSTFATGATATQFVATLQPHENSLTPDAEAWSKGISLRKSSWIAVVVRPYNFLRHYRVDHVQSPHIYLSRGGVTSLPPGSEDDPSFDNLSEPTYDVTCHPYDQDYDSLKRADQRYALLNILNSIPPISRMRQRLLEQSLGHREPMLGLMDEISPLARQVLRWIIASNRSCIFQVGQVAQESTHITSPNSSAEARVVGMNEWMQFRFAQGAPDKEQRFVKCVESQTQNPKHKTLFAWHGSPFHNWHTIIRQGLHFDKIDHGRAFGHGIYMSGSLDVSLGYSARTYYRTDSIAGSWVNSELKISNIVSLQEVVNAPQAFVHSNPHFVVGEKDWVQTRYLFVKAAAGCNSSAQPPHVYEQDPQYTATGTAGQRLIIPLEAASRGHLRLSKVADHEHKKVRLTRPPQPCGGMDSEDDDASVVTEEDDRLFSNPEDMSDDGGNLVDDDPDLTEAEEPVSAGASSPVSERKRSFEVRKYTLDITRTDFRPGQLDTSDIHILPPPSQASIAGTRGLMKAFKEATKVQEQTPLHELGWFVDPDRIENMYQWIVELHTFEASLPLARDMKAGHISSIVLEMRFFDDFPFSPPFVRVVKPRFLPFMQGGGGHVTEGGAICMELLTTSGWSAVNSIESILLQIRVGMSSVERPARLDVGGGSGRPARGGCYQIREAVHAFKRACTKHGWALPKGTDGLLHTT